MTWAPCPHGVRTRGKDTAHSKKLRQTEVPSPAQPLGSIPEHGKHPATPPDLASLTAPVPESPVQENPATPSDHADMAPEGQHDMAELAWTKGGRSKEMCLPQTSIWNQSKRPCKDCVTPKLQSRQPRKQIGQGFHSLHWSCVVTCRASGLWRGCASRISKSVGMPEPSSGEERQKEPFQGNYFGDIPGKVNDVYIADILRISEAFAAPLANLFAFVKTGHASCPFVPPKQLALYPNPRFW